MYKNYKNETGFPDLIVFNDEYKKIKLVEVKSENDKIQDHQHLCHEFLNFLQMENDL